MCRLSTVGQPCNSLLGSYSDTSGNVHAATHAVDCSLAPSRPSGGMCSDGEVCVPVELGQPCGPALCQPCLLGARCPRGTANPLSRAHYNACPPGYSCATPGRHEQCSAGHYCPPFTSSPELECPRFSPDGDASWGLSLGTYIHVCPCTPTSFRELVGAT